MRARDDITDDQIFKISQVTSATENMKVQPPATAGRRRRKNCGRRSAAKPEGRVRKATSDTGAKRGRARQARAAAEAFVAAAAATATPQRSGYGRCVKAGTAEEVPLETVTTASESTIDRQAEMYVANILPDPATTVYPERGSVQAASCSGNTYPSCEEPPTPPPQRRRGESEDALTRPTPVRRRRRVAVDGDERVVRKVQSGRWCSLLPVGSVVRRPSVKLVQLVAQAIHESPHRVLRVTHVYAALQNRYPYYWLQDKKGISSWKMPQGLPRLFLPTDDEAEQRDDEASTLCSGLHLNTESASNTTTAPMPSAFRLELVHKLFAPPEPQSPGVKRNLSTVQCSEFAPVTSPAQSEDDLVSVGSPPSSLPHIAQADLRKSESLNPVGWPAPGRAEEQAWQQPSVSTWTTPPSVWDGMYFQPVGAFAGAPWWATPPPMPQHCMLKTCKIVDEDRDPYNLFENVITDPQYVFWTYVSHFLALLAFGNDEVLEPYPQLGSPSYVTLTSPSQTPVPTGPSTRAQTPSQLPPAISGPVQTPEEALVRLMPKEQADRLHDILGGCGLSTADDECFAFVNVSWADWNNLFRRSVVRRRAESRASGERVPVGALVVASPSLLRPTHVTDNGGLLVSDEAD
ncbi:hypothetical protein HPB49_002340 [Dermacentor silvarum]|uniref:Uncharacterized protein n=1 Tax=Dermacentor silvarum TaxID=543639 RepID=A0ACB8DIA6_DERSI|nr:hypothetical protein HPB49_002340 [Dermacentor silvarum]